MIVLSNAATQTIQPGDSAVFNVAKLHTGCAEVTNGGSGPIRIRNGIYSLEFTGNVGGAAGTQSNLAIAVDGSVLQETTMTETVSLATDVHNVHASTLFRNCCGCISVSVRNTGTTPVTLSANPALVIKRVA